MSVLAQELDQTLQELDADTARSLEQTVKDVLRLVRKGAAKGGWPAGYFQRTAGVFAGESFERPPQGGDEVREAW